jgi:hypothetical protein
MRFDDDDEDDARDVGDDDDDDADVDGVWIGGESFPGAIAGEEASELMAGTADVSTSGDERGPVPSATSGRGRGDVTDSEGVFTASGITSVVKSDVGCAL